MAPVQELTRSESVTTKASVSTEMQEKQELKGVSKAHGPALVVISEGEEEDNVGYRLYKQGLDETEEITPEENRSIPSFQDHLDFQLGWINLLCGEPWIVNDFCGG
ncbi:hypothetical protein B0H11DRAFT_2294447 [Mycena galericulata]|nr:hypothetical protein B0H11DRAFT_2294447 [Mycena galericulata]